MKKKDTKLALGFLAPTVIVMSVYIYYPLVMNVFNSFFNWSGLSSKKTFIGLQNYIELFKSNIFYHAMLNNLILLVFGCCIILPIAFIVSCLIFHVLKGRFRNFIKTIYFLPIVLNIVVVGTVWKLFYNPESGLLNYFLKAVHLESLCNQWLGSTKTAMISILVVSFWIRIGYYIVVIYSGIASISPEYWDVAKIEGVGFWRSCGEIIFPMILPTISTCVTMMIIFSINDFSLVWMMTQGGPANSTEILGTIMYKEAFSNYRMGYSSAIVLIMVVFSIAISVFQTLKFDKKVAEL